MLYSHSDMAAKEPVLRALGNGLIVRRATVQDAEQLVTMNALVHSEDGPGSRDEHVEAWTRDLMTRPHPTFQVGDFTVVEEQATGKIVSSLNLISQTWEYDGIRLGVGRPELVGTLPEYRQRGLVRAQFDIIHDWSAERGQWVQAITGIPFYYRQFGYEMTVDLGGGRLGYAAQLSALPQTEPAFSRRLAGEADLAFIKGLYEASFPRYRLNCIRDEALWRYELLGKSEKHVNRRVYFIIETQQGQRIGYFSHPVMLYGGTIPALEYELVPGYSWQAVTPFVLSSLLEISQHMPGQTEQGRPADSYGLLLGREHPAYQAVPHLLALQRKPYAWYLRVADLPGFIRHIAPALERRLAASPLCDHTGEIYLSFYRSGLYLSLEAGRLVRVEPWKPTPQGDSGDACFPYLTFLQLLFGYRSFEELNEAFVDCLCREAQRSLLAALFPKQVSNIWPVS